MANKPNKDSEYLNKVKVGTKRKRYVLSLCKGADIPTIDRAMCWIIDYVMIDMKSKKCPTENALRGQQ